MCDNQHRCEKNEHKGEGMEFGNLHNMDDKKQMDAIFQEKRHGMGQEGDDKGVKFDQQFKMDKKKECEEKKECGMKGECH